MQSLIAVLVTYNGWHYGCASCNSVLVRGKTHYSLNRTALAIHNNYVERAH